MANRQRIGGILVALCLVCVGNAVRADDWPQWRGAHRDGVWKETGVVEQFAAKQLEPAWRVPVGPGYSGPTVSRGRVFLTDRQIEPKETERVLCFAEADGKLLWKHEYLCPYIGIGYVAGPRACVTVDGERAFAIGSMGNLLCLETGSGGVVWSRDLNREYQIVADKRMPIWGIAAAPIVFQNLVIVPLGATKASVVAFDKSSGAEVWKSLDDRGQYSAPILIEQGGKPVLVCWTGDALAGLDPRTGSVYWREEMKPIKMPIGIATPLLSENRLFVTSFYDGSLMLKLDQDKPSVTTLWRRRGRSEQDTEALHSIISTPVFAGRHIYGVDSYGELRCLDADTGDRIWEDLTATPKARWSNIHFVRNGERYWMFNERGELLIGRLTPKGFEEISRAKLIEPTKDQLPQRGGVCWSHPAFANRHILVRNDEELASFDLTAPR